MSTATKTNKLSLHDRMLLRDVAKTPQLINLGFLLVGIVGSIGALCLSDNSLLICLMAVLSGLLTGLGIERLVSRKLRSLIPRVVKVEEEDEQGKHI